MKKAAGTRISTRQTVERRGRPPIDEITPPQRRTLEVIQALIEKNGFPPTMKDLAAALEITPASVYDQIKQLTRKGYIKREPRKARSIVVIDAPAKKAVTSKRSLSPNPTNGSVLRSRDA